MWLKQNKLMLLRIMTSVITNLACTPNPINDMKKRMWKLIWFFLYTLKFFICITPKWPCSFIMFNKSWNMYNCGFISLLDWPFAEVRFKWLVVLWLDRYKKPKTAGKFAARLNIWFVSTNRYSRSPHSRTEHIVGIVSNSQTLCGIFFTFTSKFDSFVAFHLMIRMGRGDAAPGIQISFQRQIRYLAKCGWQ